MRKKVCNANNLHSRYVGSDVAQDGATEVGDVVEVPARVEVVFVSLLLCWVSLPRGEAAAV